jgi:hypothetical protein
LDCAADPQRPAPDVRLGAAAILMEVLHPSVMAGARAGGAAWIDGRSRRTRGGNGRPLDFWWTFGLAQAERPD